ncbi:hypothetical protein D9M70_297750 [compost metagenome]
MHRARHRQQLHTEIGMLPCQRGELRGQHHGAVTFGHTDTHLSRHRLLLAVAGFLDGRKRTLHGFGFWQQAPAGFGQAVAGGPPTEQLLTQVLFQRLDTPGDCGVVDRQTACRGRQLACSGHFEKETQVVPVHCAAPSVQICRMVLQIGLFYGQKHTDTIAETAPDSGCSVVTTGAKARK